MSQGNPEGTAENLIRVIDRALVSRNPADSVQTLHDLGDNIAADPRSRRYARHRLKAFRNELLAPPNEENS